MVGSPLRLPWLQIRPTVFGDDSGIGKNTGTRWAAMSICWNQNSGWATPSRHSLRWPTTVGCGIGSSHRTSLRYSGPKVRSKVAAGTLVGTTVPAGPAPVVIFTQRVELSNSEATGGQNVLRHVWSSSVALLEKFRQLQ